ncbi:structural phage protein [Vibrio phage vB_VpS_BA3]|nr:structural phage protein [Vibrio phage vB_VpS_BA3]
MSGTKRKINHHPLYTAMLSVWTMCRDCEGGSRVIKSKRDTYLPPTSGMLADGFSNTNLNSLGSKVYETYITRAYYPDVFKDAVETAVGIMHRKPANIKLSPKLEQLRDRASDGGETLQLLLRRINAEQLTTGRLGLMGDIRVKNGKEEPVILVYKESTAYNWDDSSRSRADSNLRFVMLDESSYELNDSFAWVWKEKSRVLALVDPTTKRIAQLDDDGKIPDNAVYGYAEIESDDELAEKEFTIVSVKGSNVDGIAFTFVNSRDLLSIPDTPPLEGLADLSLLIYRGEADYRQNLFMQGQDTLVTIGDVGGEDDDGDGKTTRTGAGARLALPVNGDAKYIGVDSQGLPEQRQALEADYKRAEKKTSKLMSGTNTQESGDALRIRAASQTATLPQIAQSGAAGLQYILRKLAQMLGDNPEDVVVTPNMEFTDKGGNPVDLKSIMEAKLLGAPISIESIHSWSKRSGFTDYDWEEEQKKLAEDDKYDLSFSTGNEDEATLNVGTNIDINNPDDTGKGTRDGVDDNGDI